MTLDTYHHEYILRPHPRPPPPPPPPSPQQSIFEQHYQSKEPNSAPHQEEVVKGDVLNDLDLTSPPMPRLSWMKEEALEILRTANHFDDIRLICKFVPGLDSADVVTLLSKRPKRWLGAFWESLCQHQVHQEGPYDNPLLMAQKIVTILTKRQLLPSPKSNKDNVFSVLTSSIDIATAAKQFVNQVDSLFRCIAYEDWVKWVYGIPNDPIQSLLNTTFSLRNSLAGFVKRHATMVDRLKSIQEVLPSPNPLSQWILSTAIDSDITSVPSKSLQFFIDAIKQRDKEQSSGILSAVRRFSILNTRYEWKVERAEHIKWPEPFPTDFSFFESTQKESALDLANSSTESVVKLQRGISATDILDQIEYMTSIGTRWSDLSHSILACLNISEEYLGYLTRFAEHLLDLNFDLRNVYTAAAVGWAIKNWRLQSPTITDLRVWDTINPRDNYAGCRKYMAENSPCLQFPTPLIAELQKSGNAPNELIACFQYLRYYAQEAQQNVEKQVVREGGIVNKDPTSYLHYPRLTKPPKRTTADFEDSRRDNLNMKRRKLDNDPCTLQLPLILEGDTGGNKDNRIIHGVNVNEPKGHFVSDQSLSPETDTHIAIREGQADKIRALCMKKHCKIFNDACQQMKRMLPQVAPAVALGILSGLTRMQIVLLSCMTTVVNLADWTKKEREAVAHKFTSHVEGIWDSKTLRNDWEKLAEDIGDKASMRRWETLAFPSGRTAIEIWLKLEGISRDTVDTET